SAAPAQSVPGDLIRPIDGAPRRIVERNHARRVKSAHSHVVHRAGPAACEHQLAGYVFALIITLAFAASDVYQLCCNVAGFAAGRKGSRDIAVGNNQSFVRRFEPQLTEFTIPGLVRNLEALDVDVVEPILPRHLLDVRGFAIRGP